MRRADHQLVINSELQLTAPQAVFYDLAMKAKFLSKFAVLVIALLSYEAFSESLLTSAIAVSGDLRYRLNRAHEAADDFRVYHQLRVRMAVKAEVNEATKFNLRLATATSSISTNQTVGDSADSGMARRNFGLDQAYLDSRLANATNLWLGRTANPFWAPAKSQILFDSDLAFEGLAARFQPKWSSSSAFFNVAGFMISENYAAPTDIVDTALLALDGGYSVQAHDGTLTVHVATYQFLNTQNKAIATFDKGAKVDAYSAPFTRYKGNSVYQVGANYFLANKYTLLESGVEFKQKCENFEYVAYGDYILNTAVTRQGVAQEYGVGLKWKSLNLGLAYISKAADSMVAAFTDSDANGGGTDNRGFRVQVGYGVATNMTLNLAHYWGDRGVDTTSRAFTGTQADVVATF